MNPGLETTLRWFCLYILSEEERGLPGKEEHRDGVRRQGRWAEASEGVDALMGDSLARSMQQGRGPGQERTVDQEKYQKSTRRAMVIAQPQSHLQGR